jgi:hypothetical protein
MKTILSLLVTLCATSALAFPNVGDLAMYEGKVSANGQNLDVEVLQYIENFDPSQNKYLVVSQTLVNGAQQDSSSDWADADQVLSQSLLQQLLGSCAANGGTLESVTAPAGQFDTCKLPTDDGHIWLGVVPFGIVKFQSTSVENGTTVNQLFLLKEFKLGQN